MSRSFGSISEEERWTTVYVAANSFEADLVRGLLQEEEIVTLGEPDLGGVFFGRSSGLRILVPREHESAARELLRAYEGREHLNVINLADYMPDRRATAWSHFFDRLLRLLAIPLLILIVLSLVFVVFRWV